MRFCRVRRLPLAVPFLYIPMVFGFFVGEPAFLLAIRATVFRTTWPQRWQTTGGLRTKHYTTKNKYKPPVNGLERRPVCSCARQTISVVWDERSG